MMRLPLLAALLAAPAPLLAQAPAHTARMATRTGVVADGHSILMVQANAVPGQETQFEAWYDTHIRTILALPGVVRAQRFKMAPRTGRPDPAWGYVIIYEFMGTPDALMGALGAAAKEGKVELPDKRYVLKTEGSTWSAQGAGMAVPAQAQAPAKR